MARAVTLTFAILPLAAWVVKPGRPTASLLDNARRGATMEGRGRGAAGREKREPFA